MVQQVIDKFNEYSSIHCGSAMPSGDKEHPTSIKKVALRELRSPSANIKSKSADNSPAVAKERGSMMDSAKAFGTKRQKPECSSSQQPHVNRGLNGHLVYARRKLDIDRCRKNTLNGTIPLNSSIFSKKSNNQETKEAKDLHVKTQEANVISRSNEETISGLQPAASKTDALVDPEKPNNQYCIVPGEPQIPNNIHTNALIDPQKPNCQPVDKQRPHNPDMNVPLDPKRPNDQLLSISVDLNKPGHQACKIPVNTQRPSSQDLNASVYPQRQSNQDLKVPDYPKRPSKQGHNAPVDPQGSGNQNLNGSLGPQRPLNYNYRAPLDPQRPNNQDSGASVDPQRQQPRNRDWKERYFQLQVFLKKCDQSNQEDYKRMLRSLTAAGRSTHAIELERRALNLLLEEAEELHRMQVLNVVGEAKSRDIASPSTQNLYCRISVPTSGNNA